MKSVVIMDKIQITKQRIKLPIHDVEIQNKDANQKNYHKHSILLPNSIRSIICGASNSGKTNVIISLLESPNGLRFENVYVYAKSLFQPKYIYLKQMLSSIKGLGCYMFSSNDQVIPLEEVKSNSVFIFDDVICEKQDNIRSYFCMGRHKNVDSFYLSQSYAHIPKHLVRENTNFLVLFKTDLMNLKHVFNDFNVYEDMTFDTFQKICSKCWSENYGFLVIDTERSLNNGKYRKKFDNFITITSNEKEINTK